MGEMNEFFSTGSGSDGTEACLAGESVEAMDDANLHEEKSPKNISKREQIFPLLVTDTFRCPTRERPFKASTMMTPVRYILLVLAILVSPCFGPFS